MAATNGRILVIGAGPAGCALSCFLAQRGVRVAMLGPTTRPPLVVGESLIPAVIPLLRELNIEEEVRAYSTLKPGASFFLTPENETTIDFARDGSRFAPYAYNVPRDRFDQTLAQKVRQLQVPLAEIRAEVLAEESGHKLRLGTDTAKVARELLGGDPTCLVDATGRVRLASKLLGVGATVGDRSDNALFAHCENVDLSYPGNIHINRLSRGWSWRIPLPGKVSVGIVAPAEAFKIHGSSLEEQYEWMLRKEPILSKYTAGARRVSSVAKYNNYQLISDRFFGSNWALVGDAAGFVDPIFSSGLHLALAGAKDLARALTNGGTPSDLSRYEHIVRKRLRSWQSIVRTFYSGRLFGLTRAARLYQDMFPWNLVLNPVQRSLRRSLSGMVETDSLTFRAAKLFLRTPLGDKSGSRLAIR